MADAEPTEANLSIKTGIKSIFDRRFMLSIVLSATIGGGFLSGISTNLFAFLGLNKVVADMIAPVSQRLDTHIQKDYVPLVKEVDAIKEGQIEERVDQKQLKADAAVIKAEAQHQFEKLGEKVDRTNETLNRIAGRLEQMDGKSIGGK